MQFKDVIGNKELKEQLVKMAVEGRVPHAFMFIEKEGYGALPLALAFIQYLSCRNKSDDGDSCGVCPVCVKMSKYIHPDVHFVFPVSSSGSGDRKPVSGNFIREWSALIEKNPYFTESDLYKTIKVEDKIGAISVNEARELLYILNLKSYEGYNKYVVMWLPERMSVEAANRLLKIIEEPTPDTYFFFITHSPENVLKTIISRTLPLRVHPIDVPVLSRVLQEKFDISPEHADIYARTTGGSLGLAIKFIKENFDGELYLQMISSLLRNKLSGDLYSMLSESEDFISLGREKQKEFLIYSLDFIRKIMMNKKQLSSISNVLPDEAEIVNSFAKNLSDSFFEKAVDLVEDALLMIEANVNAKIVFCNIVNHLFLY